MPRHLTIHGGLKLGGVVHPSGNKNAVLPMLCASLLTDDDVIIENVPNINDVTEILQFFEKGGSFVDWNRSAKSVSLNHRAFDVSGTNGLPTRMRSSVMLVAPLLVRFGWIKIGSDVTGCALGAREIDPHVGHWMNHGAEIRAREPLELVLRGGFRGAKSWPEYASVTATSTFLLCSAVAKGVSVLRNPALEPHVRAVRNMLVAMGAAISNDDAGGLVVEGVETLRGGRFHVPDDHHEVATFLAIGAASGGQIHVKTAIGGEMELILAQLRKLGVTLVVDEFGIRVDGWSREVTQPFTNSIIPKIEAAPWPYFPADLLPQLIGLTIGCRSEVLFWNKVYEGALGWVGELSKFGARVVQCDPHRVIVSPSAELMPATVEAPYIIRVVLGLVIAAIQINGTSVIRNADPIWRAHPNFVENLKALNAVIDVTHED